MMILIACEESQIVCNEFRKKGHIAFSCDLEEPSGKKYEWHIKRNVLEIIDGNCDFETMDGKRHKIKGQWDMIIAHPPCTYLTVTGNRWYNIEKYGKKAIERNLERIKAIDFFLKIAFAKCDKIIIENPIGIMSTTWKKPQQIIQPYMFGDRAEKKTCLWLKGVKKLTPTDIVKPPERIKFNSGKTMPAWYADAWKMKKEERSKYRSKTFPGLAKAMAEQWG